MSKEISKTNSKNPNNNTISLRDELLGNFLRTNTIDAINNITGHITEWKRIGEEEKTKRHSITAQRDVFIEGIRAERDQFMAVLEKEYGERAKIYDSSFAMLDKALESRNADAANMAMAMILEQIKKNPIPSLGEFKKSFRSGKPLDF